MPSLIAFSQTTSADESVSDDGSLIKTTEEANVSWRERYEVGPGDVINFSFYGRPELDRPGIRIAPDGTIGYLQALGVEVAGMTIDEIRLTFQERLSKYFREPRIIVTPGEISSKRYVVLGKVTEKGIYTLDRPMTLVEAVARAGGMEVGLFEQNTVELADMDRSFLSRGGEKVPVDFRALFLEGDLKQNVEIEPNDYIYIASNTVNSYYVLGAVNSQSVQAFTPGATLVTAITRRSGFSPKAWLQKVIVVRGSLQDPEVFVVDIADILTGDAPDFPLQPKDIVYVSDRPFSKVEELLDAAIRGFLTSATTNWVNKNFPDLIENAVLP
ncbi:polysaccharide biosynthesis/export family protein [Rubellicoccus peritrichatus]|uniref:Polysaccharide biosynthesis/export family protein n=1 Tax=Rubellicoccus peritrichatus TaxID=3080537 RepID=A0AAQ3L9D1_9BACT|nr:polysaccharide biosynthesis/export family protein [Puniceicoccus sp. CR14]WOO42029.1 polysaccharide biosynthesis/export family protein [Puniceicoccus sp. CR14]